MEVTTEYYDSTCKDNACINNDKHAKCELNFNIELFQDTVRLSLAFNKGILDTLTKHQQACAALSRAVVKAASSCGCIKIQATPQRVPPSTELNNLADMMDTHITGKLCQRCTENIEHEISTSLYYLAAIGNAFDIDIQKVILSEAYRSGLLGKYYVK